MTYRGNVLISLAVAFIAAGVMSLAAQKPSKCTSANTYGLLECLKQYMNNGHLLADSTASKLKKSAEVADYNATDTCADVASLVEKTKTAAPKALGIANDGSQLVPWIFYEGKPMYLDTAKGPPDTISITYGAYEKLTKRGGGYAHLIMTEDSLSYESMFTTMMHEIGHAANPNASEEDILKMETCIERQPDKEKPKVRPGGGGGGWIWEVTVTITRGYCEYELRVECDRDEDGNTRDPCRLVLVKIYCTELA